MTCLLVFIMLKMAGCGKKMSLPPIERPQSLDNRYAKSKLMTYTRSRERQKMLNNIMLVLPIFSYIYFVIVSVASGVMSASTVK